MQGFPPDLNWQPYLDGHALYLAGQVVAMICPARQGIDAPWRIALNPRFVDLRYEFVPGEAIARRYVERWAARWIDRLRDRYS